MSYQWICRDILESVFVQTRQTGYASTQDRSVTTDLACELPLNYTRKSGSYVSLRSGWA